VTTGNVFNCYLKNKVCNQNLAALLVVESFVNRRGYTISLVQQGTQTARNSNNKIKENIQLDMVISCCVILNNDAHVLNNTCPAWGNLVLGL
jgi:hypothetical protein